MNFEQQVKGKATVISDALRSPFEHQRKYSLCTRTKLFSTAEHQTVAMRLPPDRCVKGAFKTRACCQPT